ncbi:MAG: aminotransferase class V-fold PLP-dependent enzyme [Spirochaetaceae bacterium]|jgi:cysteine desulfurase|nr:aminotransferase class V-fold PLP-dependent enzyme [Spirochaetaceae bacterium]
MQNRRYFDWAATAPPDVPLPRESGVFPWGNPSSRHREGREARDALEDARNRCAAALGVPAKYLFFTSGGTESNALLLFSTLFRGRGDILFSVVEHPSVSENCRVLERLGKRISPIAVEGDGRVSLRTLDAALQKNPESRLAVIMGVNNETGAVTDLSGLINRIRNRGGAPVHVHGDMVQAAGKIPLDLTALDLDSASLSAHKLGGPRGIGLLYCRNDLEPLYRGGGQEGGRRPGTENTAGAAALADCLEQRLNPVTLGGEYEAASCRWKTLIQTLRGMDRCSLIPRDRGDIDPRFSPYILQAAFHGIPGEVMVRTLDDAGFAVSTGSACSSGKGKRPVLTAMGVDEKTAFEGIRISQGWSTTAGDVEALAKAIGEILKTL